MVAELPVFMNPDNLMICGGAVISEDGKKITLTIDTEKMLMAVPLHQMKNGIITAFFVSVNYLPTKEDPNG